MRLTNRVLCFTLLLTLAGCSADSGFTSTASSRAAASVKTSPATEVASAVMCTEPRKQMCTREYRPVCGQKVGGTTGTYSNKCTACSNAEVKAYTVGACQ